MSQTDSTGYVYSTLATDPDLGEIVEMFVDEMPDKIANLQKLLEATDWELLRRAAHQLKGAGGSYGFDPISHIAARLENTIHQDSDEEEIRQSVESLVDMCQRVRAGMPE